MSRIKQWLRRIRGAIGMGLTWAAGWTLLGMSGVVVVYTLFPTLPDLFDIWIPVFAYPGFLAGVGFSVVLRVAEGRRSFDELSLPRFAALGAVGGLMVSALVGAFLFGNVPHSALAAFMGTSTLLGAVSAWGSLAVARMGEARELLDASADGEEGGLTKEEKQELLGTRASARDG